MLFQLRSLARRVGTLVRRGRVETRLRDELQLQTDLVAADRSAGHPPRKRDAGRGSRWAASTSAAPVEWRRPLPGWIATL